VCARCSECKRVSAYLVQVAVLNNHQNGRDTHIRQLKVFGPRLDMMQASGHTHVTTVEFSQFATIR